MALPMPGFGDTTFIVLLALLLFGPKKLPVLARQLGKLMADFRRASNEFRTQMEEELRISEQADRQKQVAAIEAAAPPSAEVIPEPEHPHLPPPLEPESSFDQLSAEQEHSIQPPPTPSSSTAETATSEPLPIATSGGLNLMPPSTGLPIPSSAYSASAEPAPDAHNVTLSEPAPQPNGTHDQQSQHEAPVHG